MTTPALFLYRREVTMDSAEVIAVRITEYIQAQPTKTARGTQIAQFLRFVVPGFSPFNYGTSKLHLFLAGYVRDVIPIGKSGGDVVYGIRSSQLELEMEKNVPAPSIAHETGGFPAGTHTASVMHRQLWKSFSSPNSLWIIYANAETGQVEVVPPGGSKLTVPWVVIPPCSADKHRQIAERFVAALSDERQREALRDVISQPRWWDQIYAATLSMGKLREWQIFRRREVQALFSEALAEARIPTRTRSSVHSIAAPTVVPSTLIPPTLIPPTPVVSAEQPRPNEEELLRRAVISVVQKMSVSELRNLALPVGNLLDELRRST
jgi:hypothetical protein